MKLEKYKRIIRETPFEVKEDVRLSMDILERIHELLQAKFGGKQKLLAEKMGKSEAEISKLLSGIQNYTTKTIIKLEAAFGAPILVVCTEDPEQVSTFVEVKLKHCIQSVSKLEVTPHGFIEESTEHYKDFKPVKVETK